jgi:hypothetical protein
MQKKSQPCHRRTCAALTPMLPVRVFTVRFFIHPLITFTLIQDIDL